jgi:acyl-CoA thioester hydrolase
MSGIETLKGYVNTWECDENAHLNVQFYFRFFEDAGAHFQRLADVPPEARREPTIRHVRYHGELRVNAAVRVESFAIAGEEDSAAQVVHMLYEDPGGRLSATCLESYADVPQAFPEALNRHAGNLPETARPRSVSPVPIFPGTEGGSPQGGRNVLSARIRAGQCRPDGTAFDSAIIGLNSDSAAFFWGAIGVDGPWLEKHGLGRVAVEMKLTRVGGLRNGDLMHIVSRPIAVARSTITFENRFVRSETGEVDSTVQVTGLMMDLTTRRAEPLPDPLRARIEMLISAAQRGGDDGDGFRPD